MKFEDSEVNRQVVLINAQNFMSELVKSGSSLEFAVEKSYEFIQSRLEDPEHAHMMAIAAHITLKAAENVGISLGQQRRVER